MDDLPLAFGKRAAKARPPAEVTKRRDEGATETPIAPLARVEPAPLSEAEAALAESDDEDDLSDDFVGQEAGLDVPVSHELVMKGHTKAISALAIDPAGTRVLTGSYDYECKLWDFAGMSSDSKPFRTFEPRDGHQVTDAQFSPSGDSILVAMGANQIKLYDRNGEQRFETVKGDMYIRDLRHTAGHVAAVHSVAWHPKDKSTFLSASEDSTVRLWDVSNPRKSKSVIVVKSKERGGKTKVTAASWTPDTKQIATCCEDGALHFWAASSNFVRPSHSIDHAHAAGQPITSIAFLQDPKKCVTRSLDGTVKLWDLAMFKKPVATASDLRCINPETNVTTSPDGRYVLTGVSGVRTGVLSGTAEEEKEEEARKSGAPGGKLVVLDSMTLDKVREIEVSPYSVTRVIWHAEINQIITGSADGRAHVFYSPTLSFKGALLAANRQPRRKAADEMSSVAELNPQIIAPGTLPLFQDRQSGDPATGKIGTGKRRRERERHDPQKTLKPLPPMQGRGRGGRVGSSANAHVVQGLVKSSIDRSQDPREALLKYATKEGEEGEWTKAWAKTQPKPVFDPNPVYDDNDEQKR